MRKTSHMIALLLTVFLMQSCQAYNVDREYRSENISHVKELVLNGRVSLPIPDKYEKVLVDEYSTIVVAPEYRVVYRWIEKEEIEFVGSNKSPYHFFKSAFDNPTSEEEKRFLEGVKSGGVQYESSGDIEFYYFGNNEGRQLYILSQPLDFVVEVLYVGDGDQYMDSVLTHSKIQ